MKACCYCNLNPCESRGRIRAAAGDGVVESQPPGNVADLQMKLRARIATRILLFTVRFSCVAPVILAGNNEDNRIITGNCRLIGLSSESDEAFKIRRRQSYKRNKFALAN